MQVKGNNYLLPIGTDIEAEDEVKDEAVDAGSVLRKMESAGNRHDYPISTGILEGTNNKIKTLSKQAYGFRD